MDTRIDEIEEELEEVCGRLNAELNGQRRREIMDALEVEIARLEREWDELRKDQLNL
jgi:hypothetical protein